MFLTESQLLLNPPIGITFHPISISAIIAFIAMVILIVCSALMSGSEAAFFSLSPSDIDELKKNNSRRAAKVITLLKHPERLLAAMLIGNNLVNVAVVILSSFVVTSLVDFGDNHLAGFVIQVVVVTFLLLLFGEISPKIYATSNAANFAKQMAFLMSFIQKLFSPLITILIKSTKFFTSRVAVRSKGITMDDLSNAFELTSEELIEEKDILEGIIKFGNIDVCEIMTPRVNVVDLDIKFSFTKVIAEVIESGYSRFPVYTVSPDNIKGVLYIKDLLPHLHKSENFRWQSLVRPAFYIPETKKINDLLEEFQSTKTHMAIIIDEYGGTSGIVTLEDILEEIVGNISDEYDEDEIEYQIQPDGSMIFEGSVQLSDFAKVVGIDMDVFDEITLDAETLAGLILEVKGEMPQKHDEIAIKGLKFIILSASNRRITKIKFIPSKSA